MVAWNCLTSLRTGRIAGNNPWNANSLEWYTTSPPPDYNFDSLPPIRSERPLYDLRQAARARGGRPHRLYPPKDCRCSTRRPPTANITLALKLGLFSAFMFIMTMIVGELVVHA